MQDQYAESVVELLAGGGDLEATLKGLKKTLEAHGHTKLYPGILRTVVRTLNEAESKHAPHVLISKQADYTKLKSEIADTLKQLGTEEVPVLEVDETITGGYVASFNHQMVDKSYKKKLLDLYHSIITT